MSWQGQPYNPVQPQSQWPPPGGAPAYGGPYNPAQHQSSPQGGYYQPQQGPTSSVPPGGYAQGPPPTQAAGGYSRSQGPPQNYYQGQPPPQSTGGYSQSPPQSAAGKGGPPQGVDPELWTWFKAVDRDQSGKITAIELREALLNSNWSHFNAETCRLLIGMFDTNQDGTIEFFEFAALWKYVQEWKGCFDRFDTNKSGNIDSGELKQALESFGYRLSMEFCKLCTRVFDRSDRHTMKFDDFIQCCVMLRALTESFKRLDTNRTGIISINYEQFLEMAIDNTIQ